GPGCPAEDRRGDEDESEQARRRISPEPGPGGGETDPAGGVHLPRMVEVQAEPLYSPPRRPGGGGVAGRVAEGDVETEEAPDARRQRHDQGHTDDEHESEGVEFQSVLPPETRGDRIPPRRRCLLEVHSGSVYERSLNQTLRRSSAAPHRGKTQGAPLHGPSLIRERRVEGGLRALPQQLTDPVDRLGGAVEPIHSGVLPFDRD